MEMGVRAQGTRARGNLGSPISPRRVERTDDCNTWGRRPGSIEHQMHDTTSGHAAYIDDRCCP